MIKGTQRRIIMVKDTESPYFDSAYFVIKSDISSRRNDSDILSEANRMIEAYHKGLPQRESSKFTLSRKGLAVLFSLVTLLGGVLGFAVSVFF